VRGAFQHPGVQQSLNRPKIASMDLQQLVRDGSAQFFEEALRHVLRDLE
jgi:hypothetical protein